MEKLGINLPSLIAFIINFVILLALLIIVAYRPIVRMLDERSAKIRESMDQAERIKQESARATETIKAQLEAGRKEGQAIVAQASQNRGASQGRGAS